MIYKNINQIFQFSSIKFFNILIRSFNQNANVHVSKIPTISSSKYTIVIKFFKVLINIKYYINTKFGKK